MNLTKIKQRMPPVFANVVDTEFLEAFVMKGDLKVELPVVCENYRRTESVRVRAHRSARIVANGLGVKTKLEKGNVLVISLKKES